MSLQPGAIGDAVRAALTRREAQAPARFAAPLVTAIIADVAAGTVETLAPVLREVIATLAAAGIPRGRQFVLFVREDGARAVGDAASWRAALQVPALFHDPAGATFKLDPAPEPIELDDELREAEAIVTVGPAEGFAGQIRGGPLLLCPGAVGANTLASWQRRRETSGLEHAVALSLEVERLAPVDLAVTWDPQGQVTAAPGGERFAALTRAAGWA